MAIKLEKGQRINLEKETGAKLTNFCVGCNWGAIIKKTFFGLSTSVVDVDLDLSRYIILSKHLLRWSFRCTLKHTNRSIWNS